MWTTQIIQCLFKQNIFNVLKSLIMKQLTGSETLGIRPQSLFNCVNLGCFGIRSHNFSLFFDCVEFLILCFLISDTVKDKLL